MNHIIEGILWILLISFMFAAYYYVIFWLPVLNDSTNPLKEPIPTKLLPIDGSSKVKCSVCGISEQVGNLKGIFNDKTCDQIEQDGAKGLYTFNQCSDFPRQIDSVCNCQSIVSMELCDDTDDLEDFLKKDYEYYMIELLESTNIQSNIADKKDVVLADYVEFLENKILPDAQGEIILDDMNRIAQWPHERPRWSQAIVTKFTSGYLFQKHVLENPLMEAEWRKRSVYWKNTYVWFGVALERVNFNDIPDDDEKTVLVLHSMQFAEPDGPTWVSKFDRDVRKIKEDHKVILHAKWSVALTCIGSQSSAYDQLRFESAPSLEDYSDMLATPEWSTTSRIKGLTEKAFTAMAMTQTKIQ